MFTRSLISQNVRLFCTLGALLSSLIGVTSCSTGELAATTRPDAAAQQPSDAVDNGAIDNDAVNNSDIASTTVVETIESATLESTYVLGLEAGMPYGEARAKLLEQGWLPHTYVTNGAIADWNDTSIQQMTDLGFSEVKDCSGNGIGLCSFEFVFGQDRAAENGAVLTVSAAQDNQSEAKEPLLWSWEVQNSVNTTYENQVFSEAIYQQLRADGFCQSAARCDNRKYAFGDVLLWSALGDFGTRKVSIFPRYTGQSLSAEDVLAYARILDVDSVIDFDDRRVSPFDSNETYYEFGTPQENIADGRGGVTFVKLAYQEDGTLSEISFENVVF